MFEMLGAVPAAYTDKSTVERVQRFILALPKEKQLPEAQPLAKAVLTQANAFGVNGPTTKVAVKAFNIAYGFPDDGEIITAGTLEAMTRPDLKPGAGVMAEASQAAANIAKAPLQTPAQVQEAKKATAAVVAKVAESAPPEMQSSIAEVQALVEQATTPDEVRAAAKKAQGVAEQSGGVMSFLTQEYAHVPVWLWGVAGTGFLAMLWNYVKTRTVAVAVGG